MPERILWTGKPRVWRAHPLGVVLATATLVFGMSLLDNPPHPPTIAVVLTVAPLLLLIWWILQCLSTRLTITERQIVLHAGFWIRHTHQLLPTEIGGVSVAQSLLQRLLGAGRLSLTGPTNVGTVEINGIGDPHNVAELLHELREAASRN